MSSEGRQLADIILKHSSDKATKNDDGKYYPRTSAVSRCPRDMAMHRYGEPWSDRPESKWGTQFRFDMGHDTESRVIDALEAANITVMCQQMTVDATTSMGLKVTGHMDGIVAIPHEYAYGGKWYVMDVKSAGPFIYRRVFDEYENKPKNEHIMQVSVYAESVVNDEKFPELNGIKVSDLHVDGYEFGGGLIIYIAIDRPTVGYGEKKKDMPKLHVCQFDIDSLDVEMFLDVFDEVEMNFNEKSIPGIPDKNDDVVWGGIRCSKRWCNRYSVCQGLVEPKNKELSEVLNG
tara:strand:- start:660 stop:1529 length:870 start_codon:yes stop_codon:yes gene_type:complete